MNRVTEMFWGRAIDEVELLPPIFILGHWRSGTTLIHELLAENPAFAAPTVYQGICPSLFLPAPWYGRILNASLGRDAAFRQRALRPRQAAGGRVRARQSRHRLAVREPGLSRATRRAPATSTSRRLPDDERERWERGLRAARPPLPACPSRQAARSEVAVPHRAHGRAPAPLPRGALPPYLAPPLQGLPVDGSHLPHHGLVAGAA